ncbi:hypothetical protein BDR26DRAFT_852718 [Obelidium mucronatum]|nr:hypothetical protein BDR26DRAFT_852718 [Obelidium mucronatum]
MLIQFVKRQYKSSQTAQWIAGLVQEYGPAWVVSAHIVGWFCFFVLWALLIVADVHPSRIADYFNLPQGSQWRSYIDTYGVPAAAYVLNRIIFPIRIALEVLLVRLIHVPVNRVLKPHWDWFWGSVFLCLGWSHLDDDDGGDFDGGGNGGDGGNAKEMTEYHGVPHDDCDDEEDEEEDALDLRKAKRFDEASSSDDLSTLCASYNSDAVDVVGRASRSVGCRTNSG